MGYTERHHILPKCMGGSNEKHNLVDLTAEEHFLAHQLLVKMYPDVRGVVYAAIAMCGNPYGKRSNKSYGWLRRAAAKATSLFMLELFEDPAHMAKHKAAVKKFTSTKEYREKISKLHKGKIVSEQARANIADASRNRKPYTFTDKAKANISEALKRRWKVLKDSGAAKAISEKTRATRLANGSYAKSPEHRAKISEAQKGRSISPEQRAKISNTLKGRKKSPEHIAKVAAANRKPPPTPEGLELKRLRKFANLSARNKGKTISVSHKAKISEGLTAAYKQSRRPAMAKLTDDQVREIRFLLAGAAMTQREIAARYGVSAGAISELKSGKSYRHVK